MGAEVPASRDGRDLRDAGPFPRLMTPLCVGGSVTRAPGGRVVATVELHGEVLASNAVTLSVELEQLVSDGVEDVVVDLTHVPMCTSHGFDVLDDVHRRLQARGGSLCLAGAQGVVARALHVLVRDDPTFAPVVVADDGGRRSARRVDRRQLL